MTDKTKEVKRDQKSYGDGIGLNLPEEVKEPILEQAYALLGAARHSSGRAVMFLVTESGERALRKELAVIGPQLLRTLVGVPIRVLRDGGGPDIMLVRVVG